MKTELVKFDSVELQQLEPSRADQIKSTFEPMQLMLSEFEDNYNLIISESENGITKAVTAKAKRLRVDISKVRIETEKIRKTQKEEYLRAGKAIDGVSNILKWAVTEKENKLKEIENYFEIQEKNRLDLLQIERSELLADYLEDANERNLSSMDEDVWAAYFNTKKSEYNDRIAAEKQAETERIEKEKAERLENERIRKENEALRLEREKREKEIEAERLELKRLADIETAKQLKIQQDLQAKADKERLEAEKLAEIERKKQAALIAQERFEREKAEKELRDARDHHARIEVERLSKIESEKSKGDADKVTDLINDLEILKTKYVFESENNKRMYSQVSQLLVKVINHINK